VFLHQILCYSARNWNANLQIAAGSFRRADRGADRSFELYSHFKSVLTSLETLNALYIHWQVKHIKCGSSEGSCPQKQESLYVNLLACQEFYVHQSRAFWKTVWLMLARGQIPPPPHTHTHTHFSLHLVCARISGWKQMNVISRPLCLPDLVLCDFFPFLKVKKLLMGRKFTVAHRLTMGMRSEKCVVG
jgi:hypothetical protein